MRIRQVPVGPMANFAYLIEDDGGEAALVDPGFDVPALVKLAEEDGVRITHILATHGHFDHVQGIPQAKRLTGARVVAHASSAVEADVRVRDGDALQLGGTTIRVVHTPGHIQDAVCYVVGGTHLLTGDTLFVGECGRVDLPGSDPVEMHRTLTERLWALPDGLVVLPGHDYGATKTSTLGEEKRANATMRKRALDDFLEFMGAS